MSERICCEPGCNELGQHMGKRRRDGSVVRRARCHRHHKQHQAAKRGMTAREWENSFHAYRRYRRDYCENRDGRLGFTCTSTIVWEGQLQVDHINGIHTDNRESNLQTLCANCHAYKSYVNQDWLDKSAA
jgi:hypothetical protein